MSSPFSPPSAHPALAAALAGRYNIERKIGEGGMATVFLARDERHDRNVAIKLLHEDLGATLGAERFLAEIKTTARLQHPHILPLLDSGSADGLLYYVMPFVDGESLRDRLERERQLSIEDAVRIAREIGDALAHAHAHGIVHRDIKPENILLQGGHALVADFGISLALQHAGGQRMTQTGLSLGTPQYMSPEQAMGEKTIDARTDQYALAAVLYEMLTGEPPFTGATVQAVVAKVLSAEPEPPSTIRKTLPASVEGAVLKGLAKLPADRFSTVSGFVDALVGGAAGDRLATTSQRRATPGNVERRRAWAIAGATLGLCAGVAIGWLVWHARSSTSASVGAMRSYMMQPPEEALANGTSDFTFAPNGDLIYVGPGDVKGTTSLWRKRRSELHAQRINGTTGASFPIVSPDGASIAFTTDEALRKIGIDGGSATTIATTLAPAEGRGVWLHDGRVLFVDPISILVAPAAGGKADVLVSSSQFAGYHPMRLEILPGEKTALVETCASGCPVSAIYALDLVSKHSKMLIPRAVNPVYLPSGDLAWVSLSGQMFVAPFDARTMTLKGEPRVVAEHVASFALSPAGDLLYREGQPGTAVRPMFVDRLGNATMVDSTWVGPLGAGTLSPDGKRYAVSMNTANDQQVWLKDLPGGSFTKFTLENGEHFRPAWSRDGGSIYFIQHADSDFHLMRKRADGAGNAERVPLAGHQIVEAATGPDGWIVARTGATDTSLALLVQHRDSAPRVAATGTARIGFSISPNGRYIAYANIAAGVFDVFVSPFPEVGSARWQVSRGGGGEPRWSHDGRELFFTSPSNDLMVASVSLAPTFAVTGVNRMFRMTEYFHDGGFHGYEPLPGDQRFLMLKLETPPGRLVNVTNWMSEIAAGVPQR
jgi:serine/threonine-protein kinase